MDYVTIGKKKKRMKLKHAKRIRNLYRFLGYFMIVTGIICIPVGGIFFALIGIIELFVARSYAASIKESLAAVPPLVDGHESFVDPVPVEPIGHEPIPSQVMEYSSISVDVCSEQLATPAPQDSIKEFKKENHNVTGVKHYMDNLLQLSFDNFDYDCSKRELIDAGMEEQKIYKLDFDPAVVELVQEPDNPYDPNAVKVVIDHFHIGYIKRGSCSHIIKLLNSKTIHRITADIHGGTYKYISCEYDDEKDKDVYKIEKGTDPYYVTISIFLKTE